MLFRSVNRNYIGTLTNNETEWTFDTALTNGDANAIRINSGNAELTYTVIISIAVEAITDIYNRLENVLTNYEIPDYWYTELADSVKK